MTKRMLVDATHDEETRVAVMDNDRLVEFDYESKFRKPLKGSIFLAKVTRVEPSLQAAFVNFGGNRHGFLPFSEIHPDYFRIPIADREALIAEQEAELERQAREEEELDREEAGEAEKGENEEQDEKLDEVDELGGDLASEDLAEGAEGGAADEAPAADQDDEDDDGANGNVKEEQEELDDSIGNKAEDDSDDEDDDRGNRKDGKGGRGGRGRGRGRGRGGRGGRGRRGHRSRRHERYEDEDEETRFRFNLRRKYKIQEVIKRGQIMLIQVSKEERGNKGAAVSSYLSLPGRYCVLMPNSPRAGGVSRKIANYKDRARMRELMRELEIPKGMSVILRTAGVSRTKTEVKRDLDYLMRLWNSIREGTLESSAPSMIYEEANLIKRSVRDLYTRDVEEVLVSGVEGYKTAKDFMKMLIPSHAKRVKEYKDDIPLFNKHKAEVQIAEIGETQVTLPSGGYLVINPTEALVSVDVNSGRATKERHIEETALKTNLEAAVEVARQLRLRDLGGLVVIDFIDMEDRRNNGKVERKMRDALSGDRARIQMGRISMFGLMELSRQRMNPSLTESQFVTCPHCNGMGRVRSADATSIMVLRAIEEEGIKDRAAQVIVHVANDVAIFILNKKRVHLSDLEVRYGFEIFIRVDDSMGPAGFRVEVSKPSGNRSDDDQDSEDGDDEKEQRSRRRGRRGGRGRGRDRNRRDRDDEQNESENEDAQDSQEEAAEAEEKSEEKPKRGRKSSTSKKTEKTSDKAEDKAEEKDEKPKKKATAKKSSKTTKKDDDKAEAKDEAKEAAKDEKPKRGRKPAQKAEASNDDGAGPAAAAEYETVNEAPKEKKKGWWSLNK